MAGSPKMHRVAAILFYGLAGLWLVATTLSHAEQVPSVTGSPIPGLSGYGVDLGLDPKTGTIVELLIYHGQQQVQTLKLCTPAPVPREDAIGTINTADFNFDGHYDLALETASKNGNASYCIWLYDVTTNKFVASPALSKLTNPSTDAKTHHVISYSKGECSICYHRESYRWWKGQLIPVREESVAPADLGLQLPGGCGWLRTVREEKKGKMQFVSRTQVNDMGQACLP